MSNHLGWKRCKFYLRFLGYFPLCNDHLYHQLHPCFFSHQVILCCISRGSPSRNPLHDSCPQAHSSASCYCFGNAHSQVSLHITSNSRLAKRILHQTSECFPFSFIEKMNILAAGVRQDVFRCFPWLSVADTYLMLGGNSHITFFFFFTLVEK